MKTEYKGFELEAKREDNVNGIRMTFGYVFRKIDGWELASEVFEDMSIQEMMEELKYTVDDYEKNPKPYED